MTFDPESSRTKSIRSRSGPRWTRPRFIAGSTVVVKNEALKQKLDFLAKEEDRHKAILERLFRDHFPDRKLVVPAESGGKKAVGRRRGHVRPGTLQAGHGQGEGSGGVLPGGQGLGRGRPTKRILDYLSRTERSHYYMLRSEIDLLVRFPEYYNADDAHEGQDLFHIGA